jgi:hypothetical protein
MFDRASGWMAINWRCSRHGNQKSSKDELGNCDRPNLSSSFASCEPQPCPLPIVTLAWGGAPERELAAKPPRNLPATIAISDSQRRALSTAIP